MEKLRQIHLPMDDKTAKELRIGECVLLNGVVYSARDAAHIRMAETVAASEPLPFDIQRQTIYYVGPAPAKPGEAVGSAGPTSSYRMDKHTPMLLEHGLQAMIGKGPRTAEVVEAVKARGAVYFAAIGGAAALLAERIVSCEVVAYGDLGTEAIHRIELKDFPAIVALDSDGNDLYMEGPKKYGRAE